MGGLPSNRENHVIPYIKAKKKNSFYNLENLKSKSPSKYLLSKHRFKFLFEYLDNKNVYSRKRNNKKVLSG